jgi:hypothetical protein
VLHGGNFCVEQSGLYFSCDIEFVCNAPFGLQFLRIRTALCLDCLAHLIQAHERERISVYVFETGDYFAPNGSLLSRANRSVAGLGVGHLSLIFDAPESRRMTEANSAAAPFAELLDYILGNEDDAGRPADLLVFRRVRLGLYERQHSRAVGGRHCDPTLS